MTANAKQESKYRKFLKSKMSSGFGNSTQATKISDAQLEIRQFERKNNDKVMRMAQQLREAKEFEKFFNEQRKASQEARDSDKLILRKQSPPGKDGIESITALGNA